MRRTTHQITSTVTGTRPAIAYPPYGYFDPGTPFPRLNASMPNVVARSFGLGRGTLLRLIDEVVTPSLVDRMGAG